MKPLLYIGRLKRLEVIEPETGKRGVLGARQLSGMILCWDQSKKDFVIARGARRSRVDLGAIPTTLHRQHQVFHGAGARSVIEAEIPDRSGSLKKLALIDALVYEVPNRVKSPSKNGALWHHKFGDTKHSGNSDKGTKVMPWLCRDNSGWLYIRRRPGNIYTVNDWLRG